MQWTTFYNRSIDINKLSHQHLSNILWYFKLVLERRASPEVEAELYTRFGGIQLPYSPLLSFNYEIDTLMKKGYITNVTDSDIIVDGRWVGKLNYK